MAQDQLTSKISESIISSNKKPAFIPFIVSGYPDIETTGKLIKLFQNHGAAAVELGISFSDPLADGPVIQNAAKIALDNGITINKIFELLINTKDKISIPVILFSYINPVIRYGMEEFLKQAKSANVSGVIIPDLPIEESEEFAVLCEKYDVDLIMLVAPNSDKERIRMISKASRGFIYLVSSIGVTGVRESFSSLLTDLVNEIKSVTDVPVSVGFGISKPEHIIDLQKLKVDGAIVGSALIKIIDNYKHDQSLLLEEVSKYITELYS
jgi:tryptophan synthase alpha chain